MPTGSNGTGDPLATTHIDDVDKIITEHMGAIKGWGTAATTAANTTITGIGQLAPIEIGIVFPSETTFVAPISPDSGAAPDTPISVNPTAVTFTPTGNIALATSRAIPNPVYGSPVSVPGRPSPSLEAPPTNYPTAATLEIPEPPPLTIGSGPVLALPIEPTYLPIAPPPLVLPVIVPFGKDVPNPDESALNSFLAKAEALIAAAESRFRVAKANTEASYLEITSYYEDTIFENYREKLALYRSRLMDIAGVELDRKMMGEMSNIFSLWASRNFSIAPGMAVGQNNTLEEEVGRKLREVSSEVNKTVAKLVADDFAGDVEFYMGLEQCFVELHVFYLQQLLVEEKIRVQAQMGLYNAMLDLYNAKSSAINADIDAYNTYVQGKLESISAYSVAVEGAAAVATTNEAKVSVYGAQAKLVKAQSDVFSSEVKASLAPIEAFKDKVTGIKANADIIVANVEAYRDAVSGYAAAVEAATSEIDAYAAQIQAASSGVGVSETNAQAYAAYVQEAAKRNTVYRTFSAEQAEILMANLQTFKDAANVNEGYLRAHSARVSAEADVLSSRASAFDKQVRSFSTYNRALADHNAATMSYSMSSSENAARSLSLTNQAKAEAAKVSAGALAAKASALAGLAQGAMSALHVSASAQGGGTVNSTFGTGLTHSIEWGGSTSETEYVSA
jgi:hypothetical protein